MTSPGPDTTPDEVMIPATIDGDEASGRFSIILPPILGYRTVQPIKKDGRWFLLCSNQIVRSLPQ